MFPFDDVIMFDLGRMNILTPRFPPRFNSLDIIFLFEGDKSISFKIYLAVWYSMLGKPNSPYEKAINTERIQN